VLRSIEHRIESLVTGIFGRAFRSHVQPVELARKLVKEMDDHRTVSLSRVYVPNEYHLYLSPGDREQFAGYEEGLLLELADYLAEHARREGYALTSRPRIVLQEDADLALGEFGIATRLVQPPAAPDRPAAPQPAAPQPVTPVPPPVVPVDGGTKVIAPEPDMPPAPAAPAAPRAVLLVNGERHALGPGGLVIGRARDCDIVVDDPSVSRRHAEVRPQEGGFGVADLGSTNGTLLNGEPVETAPLTAGDRITVGRTELRFEQE
jgi:hypothetical protein